MDDFQTATFHGPDNPRELRVVHALMAEPRTREQLDAIARASNAPDVIYRLRRKGLEIITDLIPHTTADGERSRHGLYRLTREGRRAAREWLRGAAVTTPSNRTKKKTGDPKVSTEATP